MIILGIETSCDETAAAIVQNKSGRFEKARLRNRAFSPAFKILSNIVSSQVRIHAKTGGVVPEVAAREHIKNILPIINETFQLAKIDYRKIDGIAVTAGPGLITSLLVGVETAKVLSYVWKKPLIPINHLEAHIYSNWLRARGTGLRAPKFPLLALVVSGGHTELVFMKKHLDYKAIGHTRDDAAGEAFDKVAKLLNLGYPGGPIISKLAERGNPKAVDLPRPMIKDKNFDFSFAGLKTAVLYEIQKGVHDISRAQTIADLCASFQQAVVDVLVEKTIRATEKYKAKSVLLSGGVAANKLLWKTLAVKVKKELPLSSFYHPAPSLCTDNAAMMAVAGYFHALEHESTSWQKIKVDPNWELGR